MKKIAFTIIVLILISFKSIAQDKKCITNYMSQKYKNSLDTIFFNNSLNKRSLLKDDQRYILIPVVIHVIHKFEWDTLSKEEIISQIDVLNEDYGRYNFGYNNSQISSDTKIRFALAKNAPNNSPTKGYNHVKHNTVTINADDEMKIKDLSRWDTKKYLNIWIVNRIETNSGLANILGYSFLPRDGAVGKKYDGIVIVRRAYGRRKTNYSTCRKGKTLTHETGHYFNLIHTWGNATEGCADDDGISDTPPCSAAYYSKPSKTVDFNSPPKPDLCNRPIQCQQKRMIENYMDYSSDDCVNIFTNKQKEKMRKSILYYRKDLISYKNIIDCGLKNVYDSLNNPQNDSSIRKNISLKVFPNPAKKNIFIETHNNEVGNLEVNIINYLGQRVKYKKTKVSNNIFKISLIDLSGGIYIVKIKYGTERIVEKIIVN